MSNQERLRVLNQYHERIHAHSSTIQNCCKQTDDLLSRLEEIKQKLIKEQGDVADDFKEIHETHIQNTQYIKKLELYENEALHFRRKMDQLCGKPLADPVWFQHLDKQSLNEAILYELYRQGRFKAAALFIEETKLIEPKEHRLKFIELHCILSAMDQFDIEPALKFSDLISSPVHPLHCIPSILLYLSLFVHTNRRSTSLHYEPIITALSAFCVLSPMTAIHQNGHFCFFEVIIFSDVRF